MDNRFTGLALAARSLALGPVARLGAQRITLRSVFTTTQHAFTIFGVTAIVVLAVLYMRPDLAHAFSKSLSDEPAVPAAVAVVTAPKLHELMEAPVALNSAPTPAAAAAILTPAEEKALLGTRKQQEWVTSWLSKRYRVANDATNMLVSTAYMTAREIKLDPLLILAVMAIESRLNPFAESPVGAQGLMQLMPPTARRFGVTDSYDAAQNIRGGVQYLSWLLKRFNGNLTLAAAGYNAGEGAVDRHGGVPPYSETQYYVKRVALLADRYRGATASTQ